MDEEARNGATGWGKRRSKRGAKDGSIMLVDREKLGMILIEKIAAFQAPFSDSLWCTPKIHHAEDLALEEDQVNPSCLGLERLQTITN